MHRAVLNELTCMSSVLLPCCFLLLISLNPVYNLHSVFVCSHMGPVIALFHMQMIWK